jgi:ribosomal protein S18 acetylase RimI-like enzyme
VQHQLTHAIIPAGPGDAPAMAEVHVQSWRETYPGILPQRYLDNLSVATYARRWRMRLMAGSEITLVAEGPEGLVGYCSGDWARRRGQSKRQAEIHTLYVLRSAQGLGLGRRLMTGAVRTLAARGATSLTVGVLRDNLNARRFYEVLGGIPSGARMEEVGAATVAAVDYRWETLEGFLA